ncbi:hypothetical protein [Saccharicrinis aurantiacus]|uniref:hypothetical protein n=1 Tax=Saccharicrinis aurantiacus TaxID=1849719 RepID=UPI00248FEE2C|nr:hypothetical protein [Saccharicrinis aurantiacus]
MGTDIELPVIKLKKTSPVIIYNIVFVTFSIVSIISFLVIKDENNIIGKLFIGVLMAFVIIGFFIPKSTSPKGTLRMNKYGFVYYLNGHKTEYPISEISQISLMYDGYAQRARTISMILFDTGDDNKLSFKFKGLTVTYNIRIEHSYLGLIRRLIAELKSNGKTVRVLNDNGKEIRL